MKHFILLIISFLVIMNASYSNDEVSPRTKKILLSTGDVYLAIPMGWGCIIGGVSEKCWFYVPMSTTQIVLTQVLIKEIIAVRDDSLNYISTGERTTALESVVEKIQSEALDQGQLLSFDEVIDSINILE